MQNRRTYTGASQANEPLGYGDKLRLTNRDALLAVAALAFVVAVWLLCGFGLAGSDVQVFHLPLWVVAGLLGTWAAAIVASLVLARAFKNFDLDDGFDDSLDDRFDSRLDPSADPGNDMTGTCGGDEASSPRTAREVTHA